MRHRLRPRLQAKRRLMLAKKSAWKRCWVRGLTRSRWSTKKNCPRARGRLVRSVANENRAFVPQGTADPRGSLFRDRPLRVKVCRAASNSRDLVLETLLATSLSPGRNAAGRVVASYVSTEETRRRISSIWVLLQ